MIQVDKVLTKLNALEDKLDASTIKLKALTVKLDETTAKLDALTLKTKNIYDTVHYTKGYVQGGFTGVQEQLRRTCGVADEGRDLAAYAALDSWVYAASSPAPRAPPRGRRAERGRSLAGIQLLLASVDADAAEPAELAGGDQADGVASKLETLPLAPGFHAVGAPLAASSAAMCSRRAPDTDVNTPPA